MNNFSDQIKRIKSKLKTAEKIDSKLKVFGAPGHKYVINPPVSNNEIEGLEKRYSIVLPDCYKSFLQHIGNGGSGYANSGAGPFYGIYPLGQGVEELIYEDAEKYLKNATILSPEMSDSEWEEITHKIERDDISDEEFEKEMGRIYAGILPIGSQGCTYLHGIVLNGEHKGKVINLDQDRQKPKFTFENNFLDWYERWLDEIISGDLLVEGANWFGYAMGGSEEDLLKKLVFDDDNNTEVGNALTGLLKKKSLNEITLTSLNNNITNASLDDAKLIIQILAKHKHGNWQSLIRDLGKKDLLSSLQFIFWYDKNDAKNWIEYIESNLIKVSDPETFRFATCILKESNQDFGVLISRFINHDNPDIRSTTIYSIGLLPNKHDYLSIFIQGLNDTENKVIRSSLQALEGIKNPMLLMHYKRIAVKFTTEKDYILSNLERRLSEFQTNLNWIRNNDPQTLVNKTDKKWYQIWK